MLHYDIPMHFLSKVDSSNQISNYKMTLYTTVSKILFIAEEIYHTCEKGEAKLGTFFTK